MHMRSLLICASLLLALTGSASAASSDYWQHWMSSYYQHPQPERVVQAARGLAAEDAFQQPGFTATAIGFFSQVFAQHPEHVDVWFRQFGDLPEPAQRALASALWYSGHPRGETVLSRLASTSQYRSMIQRLARTPASPVDVTPVRSEASMNLQWGAFLVTGNPDHINQILAAIGDDAVGEAARSSLAFNAARHDRVLSICREQLNRQPKEVQSVLQAVIRDAEERRLPTS
jgi:hypothetical protein